METRQINVMGKMVEIAEGATFADVAKDFSGMVFTNSGAMNLWW